MRSVSVQTPRLLLGALVASLMLAPPSGADELLPPCEPDGEQLASLAADEVRVSLHDLGTSKAKEGCAVGWIQAPADEIFAVLLDSGRYAEFMPHVTSSIKEPAPGGGYLNRQVLDLPFPIKNRYYTIRVEPVTPETSGRPGRWVVPWTYVEGSGNLEENRGSWTLEAFGEARTLVVYRVHTDPGGMLPKWAVNRATKSTLPSVIQAVRERVRALGDERRAAAGGPVAGGTP